MLNVNDTQYNNIFYFFKNSKNLHVEKYHKNDNPNYKITKINKEVSENKNSLHIAETSGNNLYALFNLSEKAEPQNKIVEKLHLSKDVDNSVNQYNEIEKSYKDPKYGGYSCPHFKEVSEDAVEIDKYYLNFKIVKTDKTDIYKLYLVEKIMN